MQTTGVNIFPQLEFRQFNDKILRDIARTQQALKNFDQHIEDSTTVDELIKV